MKYFMFAWLLLCSVSSAFPALTAKLDKKKINLSDTVTLTLTSDNPQNNNPPDLSAIEDNFSILSTEHQISYNIVNQVTMAMNQWTFILLPKKEGHFHFPPISMGSETSSNELNIDVTQNESITENQPSSQEAPASDVFIKIISSPKIAYINQQIIYTVRVYSRRHLINIDYTPPQTDNALMIPLAQTQPYQITLHGDIYAVEELQYAIFANHSGDLTITPPQLKGMTYDMLPHPVHAEGSPTKIQIKPAPSSASTPFLPAQSLQISEKFEPEITDLKQGDTLIRTLHLSADGVPASLLPIPSLIGKDYSAYPTAPVLKNHQSKSGIRGTATVTITYLFNKAGQISIPAVSILWFDTVNHHMQTATLPPHTLTIHSAHTSPTSRPDSPLLTTSMKARSIPNWLIWLTGALMGVLLMLLSMVFYQRALLRRKLPHTTPPLESMKKIRQQLRYVCWQHDAKGAQQLLIKWAQTIWPENEVINISQISELTDDDALKKEIENLSASLYGNSSTPWDGKLLWKAIESFIKKNKGGVTRRNRLPELNP